MPYRQTRSNSGSAPLEQPKLRPSTFFPLGRDRLRSAVEAERSTRAGAGAELPAGEGDIGADGQNDQVSLARAAWLVTVAAFVVAALLLLLNGYFGYFLVLLAVAFAAAVNLVR